MELYITATSERATKGQGGNKEIVIDLNFGKVTFGRVSLRHNNGDNKNTAYFYPITAVTGKGGRILLHEEELKDKKQKTVKEHKHDKSCYMNCMKKMF